MIDTAEGLGNRPIDRANPSSWSAVIQAIEATLVVAILALATDGFRLLGGDSSTSLDPHGGDAFQQKMWAVAYFATALLVVCKHREVLGGLLRLPEVVFLLALALGSVAWSVDPAATATKSVGLVMTTAFGVYLGTAMSRERLLQLLFVAFLVVGVVTIGFILVRPEQSIMTGYHSGQWRGGFEHKNILAAHMALALLTAWFLARDSARWRALAAALGLLAFYLTVKAESATAFAMLSVAFLATFIVSVWRRPALLAINLTMIFCLILAAVCALLVSTTLLSTLLSAMSRSPDLTGRTELWTAALHHAGERPILGYGYKAFWSSDFATAGISIPDWGANILRAHNGFLETVLDLGGLGLLVLCAALFRGILRSAKEAVLQARPYANWGFAFMAMFVTHNLVETSLLMYNKVFWMLFVAVAASVNVSSEDSLINQNSD